MTAQAAVGFVIFASLMLMLLYFFLNHIFAIVLVSVSAWPSSISILYMRATWTSTSRRVPGIQNS